MTRALTHIGVALLLLCLSACAKTVWDKAEATQQQYSEDQEACGGGLAILKYPTSGFTGAANLDRYYLPCMQERGWVLRRVTHVEAKCPMAWPAPCNNPFIDVCPSCTK